MQNRDPGRDAGRPRVSTREAIEEISMTLLIERGYEAVTVDDLAVAAGVSRSTFFRYFGSKAAVVWLGFDRSLAALRSALTDATPEEDTVEVILRAIRASVLAGVDEHGVWWERFVLLDSVPALKAEAAERWETWVGYLAGFAASRSGAQAPDPAHVAAASALQGGYVTSLRTWEGGPDDGVAMCERMMASLRRIAAVIRPLLAQD